MRKRNGYILMLTILVSAAIIFFAFLFISFFHSEKNLAQKAEHSLIADEAAKAGIQDAIYHLKQDAKWNTGFNKAFLQNSQATYTMSFDKNQSTIPYSTNNSQGPAAITGYNGRSVPAGMVHLVSLGNYGNGSRTEEALVSTRSSLFNSAVFVKNNINLNGTVSVDSFDSSVGPYSLTNQQSQGNIGTNSSEVGAVTLNGSTNVYGTVTVGSGGTESSSVDASPRSSYQSFQVSNPLELPYLSPPIGPNLGSVSVSTGTTNLSPGTYTNLNASGSAVIQLQEGTYVFTDDMSLGGKSMIVVPLGSGTVTIYVLRNISVSGGTVVNLTEDPKKLLIYGGPETTSVRLSGDAAAYFGLYAPGAQITINGNGDIYGSLVGKDFTMVGNAGFHYDRSMSNIQVSTGTISVRSQW